MIQVEYRFIPELQILQTRIPAVDCIDPFILFNQAGKLTDMAKYVADLPTDIQKRTI